MRMLRDNDRRPSSKPTSERGDPGAVGAAQIDLGFGRIVVSEIEAPNMLVNLV